jgi:hypothetical protein
LLFGIDRSFENLLPVSILDAEFFLAVLNHQLAGAIAIIPCHAGAVVLGDDDFALAIRRRCD